MRYRYCRRSRRKCELGCNSSPTILDIGYMYLHVTRLTPNLECTCGFGEVRQKHYFSFFARVRLRLRVIIIISSAKKRQVPEKTRFSTVLKQPEQRPAPVRTPGGAQRDAGRYCLFEHGHPLRTVVPEKVWCREGGPSAACRA